MRTMSTMDGNSSRYGSMSTRRQLLRDGDGLIASLPASLVTGVTLMGNSFPYPVINTSARRVAPREAQGPARSSSPLHMIWNTKPIQPEERHGLVSLLDVEG